MLRAGSEVDWKEFEKRPERDSQFPFLDSQQLVSSDLYTHIGQLLPSITLFTPSQATGDAVPSPLMHPSSPFPPTSSAAVRDSQS